ncbi:MAG: ribose 5-phosphate isomerase B [Turicibacter sp.]|nr:ribose 5-phosphate isomerase B [Turicibacter sp.]
MRVIIGNDHAAVQLKQSIVGFLRQKGIEVYDIGVGVGEKVDYPDNAVALCERLAEFDLGVLVCGSGVGMCISANKVKGIRAVVCSEPYSARMARAHNDANVLCLGARVVGDELAFEIVSAFLDTDFQGGRHGIRVEKINGILP